MAQQHQCGTCRFYETWNENQAPFGSGLYWPEHFEDCGYQGELEISGDGINCPAYEELPRCQRHPDEHLYPKCGCFKCEAEFLEEMFGQETQDGTGS